MSHSTQQGIDPSCARNYSRHPLFAPGRSPTVSTATEPSTITSESTPLAKLFISPSFTPTETSHVSQTSDPSIPPPTPSSAITCSSSQTLIHSPVCPTSNKEGRVPILFRFPTGSTARQSTWHNSTLAEVGPPTYRSHASIFPDADKTNMTSHVFHPITSAHRPIPAATLFSRTALPLSIPHLDDYLDSLPRVNFSSPPPTAGSVHPSPLVGRAVHDSLKETQVFAPFEQMEEGMKLPDYLWNLVGKRNNRLGVFAPASLADLFTGWSLGLEVSKFFFFVLRLGRSCSHPECSSVFRFVR